TSIACLKQRDCPRRRISVTRRVSPIRGGNDFSHLLGPTIVVRYRSTLLHEGSRSLAEAIIADAKCNRQEEEQAAVTAHTGSGFHGRFSCSQPSRAESRQRFLGISSAASLADRPTALKQYDNESTRIVR